MFLLGGNLALLAVIYCLLAKDASFAQVLRQSGPSVAPNVVAALALTGVILTGAIDLSIGAIIAVAATVFGALHEHQAGPWTCFAGCYLTALALSVWNGALVRLLKIPAIIITLAGLTFYRGLAQILAELSVEDFKEYFAVQEAAFHAPGNEYAAWWLLAAVVVAVAWEACGKTPRKWLALGCSAEACRLQGVSPGGVLSSAFLASGLFLGLAAVLMVTRAQTIEPSRIARGFELEIIAAVVLGGANIFGGEGSYLGSVLGVFFLYFVRVTLEYAGVNEYYQQAIGGALIIAVIGFDCLTHRRRKRLEELR